MESLLDYFDSSMSDNRESPKHQNPNAQWKLGIPSSIRQGMVSPNTGAIGLLTGFATGQITMEGNVQHLPFFSESLNEIAREAL